MTSSILGIDPGSVSGAYGILSGSGSLIEVGDLPVVDKQISPGTLHRLLANRGITQAVVEQVSAMPKQGVSSTFRFGVAVGIIQGVLAALNIPVLMVTPAKWKKHFRLDSDAEKSRALAMKLWPHCLQMERKRDHGRSEALLLARYFIETNQMPG